MIDEHRVTTLIGLTKKLSPWATAAVAVRCARRVQPLYKPKAKWLTHPHTTPVDALETAITSLEACFSLTDYNISINSLLSQKKVLDVLLKKENSDSDRVNYCVIEIVRCVIALVTQAVEPSDFPSSLESVIKWSVETKYSVTLLLDAIQSDVITLLESMDSTGPVDTSEAGPLGSLWPTNEATTGKLNISAYSDDAQEDISIYYNKNISYNNTVSVPSSPAVLPLSSLNDSSFQPEQWLSETVKRTDSYREQNIEIFRKGISKYLEFYINKNKENIQDYQEKVNISNSINSLLDRLGMAIELDGKSCYISTSKTHGYPNGRYFLFPYGSRKQLIARVHLADFMQDIGSLRIILRESLEPAKEPGVSASTWQGKEESRQASNQSPNYYEI